MMNEISEIEREQAIAALQGAVWLSEPLGQSRDYPGPIYSEYSFDEAFTRWKGEYCPKLNKNRERHIDGGLKTEWLTREEHYHDMTTTRGESARAAEHYLHSDFEEMTYSGQTTLWRDEWYGTETNPRPAFVSKYRHNSVYGGPEEGGWYRSVVTMVKWTVFPSKALADIVLAFLREEQEKADKTTIFRPHYESLGGDDTVNSTYPEGYIPTGWTADSKATYYVEPRPGGHEYSDNSGYE